MHLDVVTVTCHQYHVHFFGAKFMLHMVFDGIQPISQHWRHSQNLNAA